LITVVLDLRLAGASVEKCGLQVVERLDALEHRDAQRRRGTVVLPDQRLVDRVPEPGLDRIEQGIPVVGRYRRGEPRRVVGRQRIAALLLVFREAVIDTAELQREAGQGLAYAG
jgi:hypothetical protein